KLDTLVGIFGIGMLPTGSKDPYALRRAALGVLRILIDKKLDLDLTQAVVFAVGQFGTKVKQAGLAEQVLEFVFDRLRARYEDEGVDVSVYL
ncbi:glycine--tRNA ligase subunit beta, partial [Pseudomonas fragi]